MKFLLSLIMLAFTLNSYAVTTVEDLFTKLPSETVFTFIKDVPIYPSNLMAFFASPDVNKDVVFCAFIDREGGPFQEGEKRFFSKGTRLITKGCPQLDFTSDTGVPDTFWVYFTLYGYQKSFIACKVAKKINLKIWALDMRLKDDGYAKMQLPSADIQNQNGNQCE